MTAGAVAALLFGTITPEDAVKAINLEVMLFLFGMFVIGEAVCMSGVLTRVSSTICRFAHTPDQLLYILIPVMGLSSAILMNDTIAIIGTPLVLSLAMRYRISPQALLLTLCFSLTTGSVLSPIGNPQNLLLVTYWNPPDPFLPFISGLWIPTAISLVLVYLIMRARCAEQVMGSWTPSPHILVSDDARLFAATYVSLLVLGGMILLRIASPFFGDVFPSLWDGWHSALRYLFFSLLVSASLYSKELTGRPCSFLLPCLFLCRVFMIQGAFSQ
jgi:Na+/H+ antiporter NhaD/arsenite permease-like protein